MNTKVRVEDIVNAEERLNNVIKHTPLDKNQHLSDEYQCNLWLKREDLQLVRSYKLRGAYNFMCSQKKEDIKRGVVCASAGNHAQGVAYSCQALKIKGHIFMPSTTPKQKVSQVKFFGKEFVEVVLIGDTFDDSYKEAMKYCSDNKLLFVHPFDDPKVIAGQGTVGLEILEDIQVPIDYIFVPIGGGGLAAGLCTYVKEKSPDTKIIGVEPLGAPAMKRSLEEGKVVVLDEIDKFVDGAAVKRVGDLTFDICAEYLDDVQLVPEGKACSTIIKLYNEEAIVAEPAGALSISVLDYFKEEIKGKNVVCVVSGSNNDIDRMQEIKERSLLYEGLKHYFIIRFKQRTGALREFLDEVLGPNDDITYFEYTKKTNRENGPAMVGIEVKVKEDFNALIERMNAKNVDYTLVNSDSNLFSFLIM
ncbi:MAG: threonine ammonia-lyase IlvA [Cytophaga sp.]|uniref:threonine ammonia-lyase IlvA n=1 Tax=Cytophaga sp. TaxID=29535 RepID=UPI003F810EE5